MPSRRGLLPEDHSEMRIVPDAVREVWEDKPAVRAPIPAWKCDKYVRQAVIAERRATVERIRDRLTKTPVLDPLSDILAILDEEAPGEVQRPAG